MTVHDVDQPTKGWSGLGGACKAGGVREDVTGDLFALLEATDPAAVGVGHGVNLQGSMGGGIAVLFDRRFDGLAQAYAQACRSGALRLGGALPFLTAEGRLVYSCASQVRPGADARLDALAGSVTAALTHAASVGLQTLMIPRIGAGIGGLDWQKVSAALDVVAADSPVRLQVVTLPSG